MGFTRAAHVPQTLIMTGSSSLVGPVTLRGRTASSRVLFGPHETNLARRREITGTSPTTPGGPPGAPV